MWQQWLTSFPELNLVDLDVGRGQDERRALFELNIVSRLLMPYDERVLARCLKLLVDGDADGMGLLAVAESQKGSLLSDIHLLAGAALLAQARFADAVVALRECYGPERNPGKAIRRLCASLRFELRLSPCLLLPLYPNPFGAELLLAFAQWRAGQSGEALATVREMTARWGLLDELKLLAGQIHLERGELDEARKALTAGADTKHDALELERNFYLAYVELMRGEPRSALRALIPALTMVREVNPHLHARARLLAAECFDRFALPLEALRQSAHVLPEEVPGEVAAEMLQREERWIAALAALTPAEIERMARTDAYHVYVPDHAPVPGASPLLSTTRDPLKELVSREMSWRKNRAEEAELAKYRAAIAEGLAAPPPPPPAPLSGAAQEFKLRMARARAWWPARREALAAAGPRTALARTLTETGHLRYDFQGKQPRSTLMLECERRAARVSAIAGAALLIAVCLMVIRWLMY